MLRLLPGQMFPTTGIDSAVLSGTELHWQACLAATEIECRVLPSLWFGSRWDRSPARSIVLESGSHATRTRWSARSCLPWHITSAAKLEPLRGFLLHSNLYLIEQSLQRPKVDPLDDWPPHFNLKSCNIFAQLPCTEGKGPVLQDLLLK